MFRIIPKNFGLIFQIIIIICCMAAPSWSAWTENDLTLENQAVYAPSGPVEYYKATLTGPTPAGYSITGVVFSLDGSSGLTPSDFDTCYVYSKTGLLGTAYINPLLSLQDITVTFAAPYAIGVGSIGTIRIFLETSKTMSNGESFKFSGITLSGLGDLNQPGYTNTITCRKGISNQVPAHFVVGQYSKPFTVFGISYGNGAYTTPGPGKSGSKLVSLLIEKKTLQGRVDLGYLTETSDLSELVWASKSRRGIQLWKDDGDGEFDYTKDSQIDLGAAAITIQNNAYGIAGTDTILISVNTELPSTAKGPTFWLAFRTGEGWGDAPGKVGYGDAFACTMLEVQVVNNFDTTIADTSYGSGSSSVFQDPFLTQFNPSKTTLPIYFTVGPIMQNKYVSMVKETMSLYYDSYLINTILDPLSPNYKKSNYSNANLGRSGLDYRILSLQMTGGYKSWDTLSNLNFGEVNDERFEQMIISAE